MEHDTKLGSNVKFVGKMHVFTKYSRETTGKGGVLCLKYPLLLSMVQYFEKPIWKRLMKINVRELHDTAAMPVR